MHRPARRIFEATRTASNLLSRQIDIQSNLPLRTIAERRRLVDALQKYGEVATFLPARVRYMNHSFNLFAHFRLRLNFSL